MEVGKKYLCKNGFIAVINCQYTSQEIMGSFGGHYETKKGEIIYHPDCTGWAASYDKNGNTSNKYLQIIKEWQEAT